MDILAHEVRRDPACHGYTVKKVRPTFRSPARMSPTFFYGVAAWLGRFEDNLTKKS
jgi:hypothetical protein